MRPLSSPLSLLPLSLPLFSFPPGQPESPLLSWGHPKYVSAKRLRAVLDKIIKCSNNRGPQGAADLSQGGAGRPLWPELSDSPASPAVSGTGPPLRSPGGANRTFPGPQSPLCFPPTSLQQKQDLGQDPSSGVCEEGALGHSPCPSVMLKPDPQSSQGPMKCM